MEIYAYAFGGSMWLSWKQTPDYDFTLDSIPPFLLRGHAHLATSGNRTVLGHVI